MKIMCVDETYNEELTVLCGVIFFDTQWPVMERAINDLKRKYFPETDPSSFEFKSYDIRQSRGVYKQLSREQLQALHSDIGDLLLRLDIRLCAAAVRGKTLHAYHSAYRFIFERYEQMLTADNQHGIVIIDQQASKIGRNKNNPDRILKDLHRQLRMKGTNGLQSSQVIKSLFVVDSLDSPGIQLADLCVYPILRRYSSNHEDSQAWQIVKTKLDPRDLALCLT